MPKKTAQQFISAFDHLSINGGSTQLDFKKLENRDGFRLRIGGYRALYRIQENVLVIEVVKIGSRGGICK